MFDRSIVLNNGVKIPQLGLGTWFIDDDKAADAVKAAVEIGYRHIDTAQAYGNERGVGEGVRTCGIPRNELFVVSKVAAEHKTYEEAMAGINETLEKMGLDYLDMMIIHSPQPWAKVNQCEDRYVEGNRAAWKALEDAYKAGKLKAIGISNFLIEDIASLLETAKIKPMVNQILLHISNTPIELVEYCQKNNIVVEAYSPIAHGEILNQPEITTIAKKYGVTVPLFNDISVEEEDLIREAAKLMGYARVGTGVSTLFKTALKLGCKNGRLIKEDIRWKLTEELLV